MWANIVIKGDNYLVIHKYKSKEKAKEQLSKDISKWIGKNEKKKLFKLCRPFGFDTREVPALEGIVDDLQ